MVKVVVQTRGPIVNPYIANGLGVLHDAARARLGCP